MHWYVLPIIIRKQVRMMMSNVTFVINVVLSLFLLTITSSLVFFKDLTINVVMMSMFSFLMALLYLIMDAPDVAITEAAVGAGISTVLMLAALSLLKNDVVKKYSKVKVFPMLIAISMFVSLLYAIPDLPLFGDPKSFANGHVASYYLENTSYYIGVPNVVTAILASFRGYDTFCETIVIFTAGLGVSLLLVRGDNA
ncbi:DUF4040 domain-containing protein [Ehrlichia ruminantium]|nr:DUF4040 domain-containing protein [Ehrlichia ruminantium]QLK52479.1 DUF4040 domain-containing protein [Ehrlichia ruminantium]QLK54309.1 DUF4040 domain-containing protein [Ehrlichia ruminantium]QLK57062.1 DUF4040 domain-containing protein [Ehrlichia ruminantium]